MNLSLTQYLRSKQSTYVQRISQQHEDILKRVARRREQAARRREQAARLARKQQRTKDARANAMSWLRMHGPAIGERALLGAACVALTLFVGIQPIIDSKDAEIAAITQQRDEWRAVATRDATSHMTINLTGHSREVRKSVRAIADLEK